MNATSTEPATKKALKIWSKAKTVSEFQKIAAGYTCRQKCGSCQKQWSATETENVSLGYYIEDGKQKTVFLCDSCEVEIEQGTSNKFTSC